jgi:hypothetical protein
MNEILKNFLPLITGLLMGLAGWLYGKKQSDANVEVTEASALSMIQDSYKELVKDMNDKFATMNKEIEGLKIELKKCNESHKIK